MSESQGGNQGPATDRNNQPVIDPTANVRDLVDAEVKRQDDLRKLVTKHLHEMADLRAIYDERLRQAETSRIDAIRQVDVGNVQRAAEVQATQASALASQVVASTEALRGQVAATATQAATGLAAALEPIQKRIDDLSRAQYEAAGQKTQVTESRSSTGAVVGYIVGGIGALVAVASLLIVLLSNPPA